MAAAVLAIGLNGAAADGVKISEADSSAYGDASNFKALAVSIPISRDTLLVRYAFNYDTPRDAVRAALAYCEEARLQTDAPDRWTTCRPVLAGPHPVEDLDENRLDGVLDLYLEETIAALSRRLELTNDSAARVSLATILQKAGRYADSEALLIDLAVAGDDLSRNALAYHWAELNIHLERAISYADSAVASRPDVASFHDTRGLVLYRLGRIDDALAATERAVALNPHPIILDHYGDILWAAWRCQDAASAWRRAASASADILFRQRIEHKIAVGPEGPPVFE